MIDQTLPRAHAVEAQPMLCHPNRPGPNICEGPCSDSHSHTPYVLLPTGSARVFTNNNTLSASTSQP